ncbi:hypothetical protein NQ317_008060 [Molorchus minor]|uniref:Uncharacterized protein n=1 Tax=Molorchus minor TaxID=1323400 RepID=A0ABQ9J2W1_9CUCU|nr:hypothetical protein NQ317_008060 [Molorchus minor]
MFSLRERDIGKARLFGSYALEGFREKFMPMIRPPWCQHCLAAWPRDICVSGASSWRGSVEAWWFGSGAAALNGRSVGRVDVGRVSRVSESISLKSSESEGGMLRFEKPPHDLGAIKVTIDDTLNKCHRL